MKKLTHPNLDTTDKIKNDLENSRKSSFESSENNQKLNNIQLAYQNKVNRDTFPDSKRERQIAREMFGLDKKSDSDSINFAPDYAEKMDKYNHLQKQNREKGLDNAQSQELLSLEKDYIDPVLAKKQEQNDTIDDVKYLKKLALNPEKNLSSLDKEKFEHLFKTIISSKGQEMLKKSGIGSNTNDNLLMKLAQEDFNRYLDEKSPEELDEILDDIDNEDEKYETLRDFRID